MSVSENQTKALANLLQKAEALSATMAAIAFTEEDDMLYNKFRNIAESCSIHKCTVIAISSVRFPD